MAIPELHVDPNNLEKEYGRVIQWMYDTRKRACLELEKVNSEMANDLYRVMDFGMEYIGLLHEKSYEKS